MTTPTNTATRKPFGDASADPRAPVARLIGLRYAEPGSPEHKAGTGVDCWEAARRAMAALGLSLPATPAEAMNHRGRASAVTGSCQPGDLLEIRTAGGSVHVGVALSAFEFIHAVRGRGVVIESIAAAQRAGIVAAIYRLPSPTDGTEQESRA